MHNKYLLLTITLGYRFITHYIQFSKLLIENIVYVPEGHVAISNANLKRLNFSTEPIQIAFGYRKKCFNNDSHGASLPFHPYTIHVTLHRFKLHYTNSTALRSVQSS